MTGIHDTIRSRDDKLAKFGCLYVKIMSPRTAKVILGGGENQEEFPLSS